MSASPSAAFAAGATPFRARDGHAPLEGLPRLLLETTAPPVIAADPLGDWVRLPVSMVDLRVRLRRLRYAAPCHRPRPALDGEGRLVCLGRRVALSPVQERLAGPLVAQFYRPVRNRELLCHGWLGGTVPSGNLRARVCALRQRLHGHNLDIATVRGVGYVLHARTAPAVPSMSPTRSATHMSAHGG